MPAAEGQGDLTVLDNGVLRAVISPLGAELQALQDSKGQDWIWSGDPQIWSGRAPVLFPIVGGCPEGKLAIGPAQYDMPRHGFARISPFALIDQGRAHCTYELRDTAASRRIYPYEFSLRLTHHLIGSAITTTAEVENRGDTVMPFGFGFHPAFRWPLPGTQGRQGENHRIVLENGAEPDLYRLTPAGLLQARAHRSPFVQGVLSLAPNLFAQDAMIFPSQAGSALRFEAVPGSGLHLSWQGLPQFALWSNPGAPFLCLEPWHGMAAWADKGAQILDRPGTIELASGACRRFSVTATIAPDG